MQDLSISTAATLSRRVCKGTGYLRVEIQKASKAEADGEPGAAQARELVTAKFARWTREAETAIRDTERYADALHFAAHLLRNNVTTEKADSPTVRLAALAVRLNTPPEMLQPLADRCENLAARAQDASERARDRMDASELDFRSVAATAALCARLPDVKHDRTHPAIKHLRADADRLTRAAKAKDKS